MRTDLEIFNPELGLTQRDYRILSALEKWGVLGLGQLLGLTVEVDRDAGWRTERFFNLTTRPDYDRGLAKRLLTLTRRGLIVQRFFLNRPKLFMLAEKGWAALDGKGKALLPGYRTRVSDELLEHELAVAAVGLTAIELLGLRVRTERERYVWAGNGGRRPAPVRAVSDLWIVDAIPKAVEVELNQKSEGRYKEIWDAYRLRLPENGAVLYLTTWPSGVSCILRFARQFRAWFVYACDLAEFRSGCGLTRFMGARDGATLAMGGAAVPDAGAAPRRVSPPSLPARQDVSAGGRLGAEPFAPPSQSVRIGTLTPPQQRRGQSVPPPASRACPRPLPLSSPSPSPEGDSGGPLS